MFRFISTTILLFVFQFLNAQYCTSNRFDTTAFTINQIDSVMNEKFGQNYNWQNTTIQNLKMDVYFPKSNIDPLVKRPLIVMIHAGGFYVGTRMGYRYYCREFAKRGYVAATIDYRIGWDVGLGQHYDTLPMQTQVSAPFTCQGDSTSSIKALYRALQDQKAAIRHLVHFADTVVNIDTNYIFVGGGSAGGVSSLGLQYLHQKFFDLEFPYLALHDSLGPLDSASNTLTESFSLAGITSMWGAIPDTSLITSTNSLPTLLIHCTGDTLVPCVSSNFYSCSNYVPAQGACVIKERLKHLNQCYEFNYYQAPYPQNGCHDVYSKDYHIERISKFTKRVMCNDCRQIIVENQVEQQNDSIVLSTPSIKPGETILFYPNPTKFLVNIASKKNIITLSIFNLQGKKMAVINCRKKTMEINLQDFPEGVYVFEVVTEDQQKQIKKVVLIR